MNFSACSGIVLKDFTAGHTREPGVCSGGVLNFVSGSQISLYGLGLYGCGTYGVTGRTVEQISIASCDIYECSQGGVRFGNSNGITIKNTVFRDLGGIALQWDMNCRGITLEGNTLPEVDIPTPTPPPSNDTITSAELRYANSPLSEFTEAIGHDVKLTLHYAPDNLTVTEADVLWYSVDPTVATITCEILGKPVCSVTVHVRESW